MRVASRLILPGSADFSLREALGRRDGELSAAINQLSDQWLVSADAGDAAKTLVATADEPTQVWSTTLTADRAVTLSTARATSGARFRIVRSAAGAFDLNVGTGPLKALAAGEWCDVEYNGSAWFLSAFGSL